MRKTAENLKYSFIEFVNNTEYYKYIISYTHIATFKHIIKFNPIIAEVKKKEGGDKKVELQEIATLSRL